jgi:hypothetical protein
VTGARPRSRRRENEEGERGRPFYWARRRGAEGVRGGATQRGGVGEAGGGGPARSANGAGRQRPEADGRERCGAAMPCGRLDRRARAHSAGLLRQLTGGPGRTVPGGAAQTGFEIKSEFK